MNNEEELYSVGSIDKMSINEEEKDVEKLWIDIGGINPKTGEIWLTPRMHRQSQALINYWGEDSAPYSNYDAEKDRPNRNRRIWESEIKNVNR